MRAKGYKVLKVILVFLFVFLAFNAKSSAQEKGKRKKRGLVVEGKKASGPQIVPNIHMQLGCESCHIGRPKQDEKEPKLLAANGDVVELCISCHEDADHHKVNLIPSADIKTSGVLPLGKYGVSKGKIVCSSCHYVHVELASNSLLRGLSQEEGGVVFNKRLDLCNACHGEEFTKKSPHVDDEKMCGFCHSSDPKKSKDVIKETIKRDVNELCDFCHGSVQGGHFLKVNPFLDKSIRKEFPATLPIIDGSVTCATCHNAHGSTGTLYLLRPDYINFAVKSKEINPHEKRVFCLSCHYKAPESVASASVKFGNDVEMCNWCHKVSPDDLGHHPINVGEALGSKITKISKDLPLKDGKVTCLSCHDRKFECQTVKLYENVAGKNANYLFGGPYKNKNDICLRCHVKSELEKTNPHKMLDGKGLVIASQCKFCHSLPSDKLVEGGKTSGLIGDVNFLCLLCHSDRDHPGSKRDGTAAKHLVKVESERRVVIEGKIKIEKVASLRPLKEIPTDLLPLDSRGYITCNTCHQVHEAGVLKSDKNKASVGSMWRMPQDQLCSACHPF